MRFAITLMLGMGLAFSAMNSLSPFLGPHAQSVGLVVLGICFWVSSRQQEKRLQLKIVRKTLGADG